RVSARLCCYSDPTPTPQPYPLSLHDALPILAVLSGMSVQDLAEAITRQETGLLTRVPGIGKKTAERLLLELRGKMGAELDVDVSDRKSTRLNSSHVKISYAVFCLKKKKTQQQ